MKNPCFEISLPYIAECTIRLDVKTFVYLQEVRYTYADADWWLHATNV